MSECQTRLLLLVFSSSNLVVFSSSFQTPGSANVYEVLNYILTYVHSHSKLGMCVCTSHTWPPLVEGREERRYGTYVGLAKTHSQIISDHDGRSLIQEGSFPLLTYIPTAI